MRNRITPAAAKSLMERQQISGLTVQAFCAQEFINTVTFYYWRKRLKLIECQEPSVLIPVCFDQSFEKSEPSSVGTGEIELTYPNGVRLSVSGQSDMVMIRELILLY